MLQKDYLMRRIEELMKLITLALRLRHDGKLIPSLEAIQQAYSELPDLDKAKIESMTPEDFTAYLLEMDWDVSYVEVIAQLLFQEGETLLAAQKTKEAKVCFAKAAPLLSYVGEAKKEFSLERMNQQARIRVVLAD